MSYKFRGVSLPEHLQESLNAYADTGRPTGGFLEAVIENDLRGVFGRGDEESIAALPAIMGFMYNEMPSPCWGFKGAFAQWIEKTKPLREANHVG